MKNLYLCDGNVPECKKTNCFKIGGECWKTADIKHAVNFVQRSDGAYTELKRPYFEDQYAMAALRETTSKAEKMSKRATAISAVALMIAVFKVVLRERERRDAA